MRRRLKTAKTTMSVVQIVLLLTKYMIIYDIETENAILGRNEVEFEKTIRIDQTNKEKKNMANKEYCLCGEKISETARNAAIAARADKFRCDECLEIWKDSPQHQKKFTKSTAQLVATGEHSPKEISDKFIEIYQEKNLITQVATETGIAWHQVYSHLRKAGAISIETRMVAGSSTERMGAFYENEFRKLVPSAVSQNDFEHQAEVDFVVGKFKVEVKSSSLYRHAGGTEHWKFRVFSRRTRSRASDFYVCFGRLDDKDMNNYAVYLFPAEILTTGNVTVRPDGKNYWSQFRIKPSDLRPFFDGLEN